MFDRTVGHQGLFRWALNHVLRPALGVFRPNTHGSAAVINLQGQKKRTFLLTQGFRDWVKCREPGVNQ